MATKGIYTKIDDVYYHVVQSCEQPSVLFKLPGTHSIMSTNDQMRQVRSNIWINPICTSSVKTNKESYDEMIQFLKDHKVTQIDHIQNRYVLFMDYSILDENGKEVNHNVTTKDVTPIDAVHPLGVGRDNELVYKQIKFFDTEFTFNVKNDYPFGIMRDCRNTKYQMRINDLSVYQDLIYGSRFEDNHYSCMENCYAYGSHTIATVLKNMKRIYSTMEDGITISAVEVPFVPRSITVCLKVALDNCIVAYDIEDVKSVITENVVNKYNPSKEEEIPEGESYPKADGETAPNEEGFYDYYMKVEKDTPDALLVVEDELKGELYDTAKMIHKEMVLFDLPDIQIGEYVKYVTVQNVPAKTTESL